MRIITSLRAFSAALLLGPLAPLTGQAQSVVIVVNSSNPISSLSKVEVSNLFLKKTTTWSGGKTAQVIDQEKSSKIRQAFAKAVHGRSAAAIDTYWQQQIFSGKDVPPPTKHSDEEVLAFVRSNPNAIGYVAPGTTLGASIKAITVPGT